MKRTWSVTLSHGYIGEEVDNNLRVLRCGLWKSLEMASTARI